jgi:hypothetical protein
MGRKQWAAFEKVTAADVNASLADQSVMVFASTAARDAAIPSPSVGMQSAVTASPDLGAPRYWDGSAWTLVQNGSPYANVWTLGDQTQPRVVDLTAASTAKNTWVQVSASLGVDAIIHGVRIQFGSGLGVEGEFHIGTGGAGSEVSRWVWGGSNESTLKYFPIPNGIGVPSGTRIAAKWDYGAATSSPQNFGVWLHYTEMSSPPSLQQSGRIRFVPVVTNTWTQVAATPPLAGGCWIVGWHGNSDGQFSTANLRIGFGAAGSEVVSVSYRRPWLGGDNDDAIVSPIWWPPSTRMAIQCDDANANTGAFGWPANFIGLGVIWRETLT